MLSWSIHLSQPEVYMTRIQQFKTEHEVEHTGEWLERIPNKSPETSPSMQWQQHCKTQAGMPKEHQNRDTNP